MIAADIAVILLLATCASLILLIALLIDHDGGHDQDEWGDWGDRIHKWKRELPAAFVARHNEVTK